MLELLQSNKISILNPDVKSAIEKSFVIEFSKALDVCEWYKDVMGIDMSDEILNQIKERFIKDLTWTSSYKEMIEIGGFSGEFLRSSEVKDAAEKRLLDLLKEESIENIADFVSIFKLEDLDFAKEKAKERFIDLARQNRFEEALKIKTIFKLDNLKELLSDFKEFYDNL
jgi:hypothetical protein